MPITSTPEFLARFGNDSDYFLSHPFLFTVEIPGLAGLQGSINSTNNKLGGEGVWQAGGNLAKWGAGNILAARQITIPNEQSSFLEAGQNSRGGFLPGYGLQQRESFLCRNLAVNFLETEVDIVHSFFTPWSIAIGIDGLTNFSLKTDILIRQYNNLLQPRKGYRFINAFPTNVEGFTVTQEPDAVFPEKTVTFTFTNYEQY